MRSRRVPVLRLGSRGPGGDARSLRLCSQAFAIVRNRSQSFAIVRNRSQSAAIRKRSRSVGLVSDLRRTCVGLAGDTKIVAKRRTVVTFYVSHYKSVNSHRDRGGPGRETQISRHFWTRLVFASQQCQQSQGSGASWSRNADQSSLLDSSSRLKSVNSHRDRGGPGRETQISRHFWTRLASSRLKSVNSHRDRGGSWSRNADQSSLLDSSRVFASQKCQQSQGSRGVVVAKRRSVVTFGLVSGLRVSKVSTVTGIGGVVVAKRRSVVTFGLASGERKGERREEKREMRGEKRGERREEKRRVDRRKERGKRRQERGEERGERGEERG